ncbi:MAG: 4Fe-4S binding protein [Archangium sp.]|nr:4Fe-4S binding protein [Archangium sp.]
MKHFLDAFKAFGAVFKSFLRPPTTVQFPTVVRPRAERYRASFALLHEENGDEACIGCLQCERICPSKVISIKGPAKRDSAITGKKRSYADDFTLDLSACIFCELCVQVCPTDAIVMTREQEVPAYSREELVLTMAKLYANEKTKTRAWGDATKLNAMQAIPKPPAAAVAAPVAAAPAPVEKPVAVAEKPVAEKPVAVAEKPVAVAEKPVAVAEKPVAVAEKPVAVAEKPVAVAEKPVAVAEQPVASAAPVTPSGVEGPPTASLAPSPTLSSPRGASSPSPAGESETVGPPLVAAPPPESKP